MDNGWVKLHRKLCDNDLWLLETFTKGQAWVDLFLNANHKDKDMNIRGNIICIKRGQLGWSELTMVKRWRWSKNKVRRFLKWLETKQQIIQQKSSLTTIITILNYDKHQSEEQQTIQQTIQQKDSRRYTNKNVKNEKKNIVDKSTKDFSPKTYIDSLIRSKQRHIHIIGIYYDFKGITFENELQAKSQLGRHLKIAQNLSGYPDEKIREIFKEIDKESHFDNKDGKGYVWTLETIHKRLGNIKY